MSGGPGLDEVKEEIAREIGRVHKESYGEDATNVDVAVHDGFVAVVMDIALSPAERTLIDADDAASAETTRESYQAAIGSTFVAIVEHATGRRVTGFASSNNVAGAVPWSAEVFRLHPGPST